MNVSSAHRKLARGIEQAQALYREVKAFQERGAYILRTERERRSAEQIDYVAYAIERERPSTDWPLLLGEIVHNVRGSLDHVIYAQAKRPSPRTQFPVFHDACEFQVKGRPMLDRVNPAVRAIVEDVQPFKTLPEAPKSDPLWVLHELWNRDKHRELATVAAAVNVPGIFHEGPREGAEITVTDWGSGRHLCEGAPVVSFSIAGPRAHEMKVNPSLIYEVRVDERSLIGTLDSVVRTAYRLVHECEAGQPFDESSVPWGLRVGVLIQDVPPPERLS